MTFTQTTHHATLTDFYKKNELEIENGWEETSGVYFSEASYGANGEILCAYSLSKRFGETVLDYIAVSDTLRGKGIGAEMINRIKEKVRRNGQKSISLTARAREFFEKQGAMPLPETHGLYSALLGECAECEQRNAVCFPCVMFFNIEE